MILKRFFEMDSLILRTDSSYEMNEKIESAARSCSICAKSVDAVELSLIFEESVSRYYHVFRGILVGARLKTRIFH